MTPDWKARLYAAAAPEYAAYQRKIISDTKKEIICVRVPVVRKLARELARENWRDIPGQAEETVYEEILLAGLVIAYAKADMGERLAALWALLPSLDSWGLTDTIAPTLKPKPSQMPQVLAFARKCLAGEGAYVRRFGIVLLMTYFRAPEYRETVLSAAVLPDGRYYVGMAQAWMLAEIGVTDYPWVYSLLERGALTEFVHNMTIRKIRESYRFTPEQKSAVLAMKRKKES